MHVLRLALIVLTWRTTVNGISIHATQGSGSTGAGNIAAYEEMQVDTAGIAAEQKEGGVRMNLVSRDGGNTFAGSFYGSFANHAMQSNNFTEALRQRGLGTPNSLRKWLVLNPSYGGRIIRDRLWFFATKRYNHAVDFSPIFSQQERRRPESLEVRARHHWIMLTTGTSADSRSRFAQPRRGSNTGAK